MKEYPAVTTQYVNPNESTPAGTDDGWLRGRLPFRVALQAQLDVTLGT